MAPLAVGGTPSVLRVTTFGEISPWHRACALRQGFADVGW